MSQMEKDIKENIDAIISAFNYNMDTEELIECLKIALERLSGDAYAPYQNIAIDLIVSFIVLRYGNYGTSPRYGWFPSFERKIICDTIAERLRELEENLKREVYND